MRVKWARAPLHLCCSILTCRVPFQCVSISAGGPAAERTGVPARQRGCIPPGKLRLALQPQPLLAHQLRQRLFCAASNMLQSVCGCPSAVGLMHALHLSAPQEHSQLADSVAGMRSASLALAAAVAAEGPLSLDGAAATPAHPSVLPASMPASVARTSLQKLGVAAAAASLPNMLRSLRPLSGGRTAAEIGACMFWLTYRG